MNRCAVSDHLEIRFGKVQDLPTARVEDVGIPGSSTHEVWSNRTPSCRSAPRGFPAGCAGQFSPALNEHPHRSGSAVLDTTREQAGQRSPNVKIGLTWHALNHSCQPSIIGRTGQQPTRSSFRRRAIAEPAIDASCRGPVDRNCGADLRYARVLRADHVSGHPRAGRYRSRIVVQENQSRSRRGTLRGLHMRRELRESKVVRCARGTIFEAVVDLRPWSPTFGQWQSVTLDDIDHRENLRPRRLRPRFPIDKRLGRRLLQTRRVLRPGPGGGVGMERSRTTHSVADRQADPLASRRRGTADCRCSDQAWPNGLAPRHPRPSLRPGTRAPRRPRTSLSGLGQCTGAGLTGRDKHDAILQRLTNATVTGQTSPSQLPVCPVHRIIRLPLWLTVNLAQPRSTETAAAHWNVVG